MSTYEPTIIWSGKAQRHHRAPHLRDYPDYQLPWVIEPEEVPGPGTYILIRVTEDPCEHGHRGTHQVSESDSYLATCAVRGGD